MQDKEYDLSSMIISIIALISIIILLIVVFVVPYKSGPQGVQGPIGFTGPPGLSSSFTGPTGPTGPDGVIVHGFGGNTGQKGPQGAPASNPLLNYNILTTSDININAANYKIGDTINIDNNSNNSINVNLIGFINTKKKYTIHNYGKCLCVVVIGNEHYEKILVII